MTKLFFRRTFIAQPASSWIDDYMDWSIYNLDSPSGDAPCCRVKKDGTFCPSSDYESDCDDCNINLTEVRSNITPLEVVSAVCKFTSLRELIH